MSKSLSRRNVSFGAAFLPGESGPGQKAARQVEDEAARKVILKLLAEGEAKDKPASKDHGWKIA